MFPSVAITRAEISQLHNPNPESSGFHGVYERESGTFVAKAFQRPICGPQRSAQEAARQVVAWWRGIYGPDWLAVFRGTGERPWRILTERGRCRVIVSIVETPGMIPRRFHPPGLWYLRRTKSGSVRAEAGRPRDPLGDSKSARAAFAEWERATFGIFQPVSWYYLRATRHTRRPIIGDEEPEWDEPEAGSRPQAMIYERRGLSEIQCSKPNGPSSPAPPPRRSATR